MRWGVLLAGAAALLVGGASGEGRHEYKLSFKSPVLFGEGHFPHFSSEGDSLVSVDSVRLVPSVQSKRGSVWSETPLPFDQWQVVLAFSISGRGRLGGDGMALWYVSEHLPLGSAMGARETFKGLMIPFDTYDNDNKRNNPHVGAIINDGSATFNPETDGFEIMKAGCIKNIRNTPTPVHARITYRDSTLTVELDTSERGNSYATCFSVSDVHLPKGYYFGLSAATGGLADDHDVVSFEVYNLNPPPRSPSKKAPTKIDQEDQQQFDKIREQVQEMRAKNEPPIQLDEGYQLLLGKLSTVEELLSDLEKLGRGQQDLRDSLETVALSIGSQKRELENKERSNSPRGNHRQQPNEAASMIQSIVHRLEDVETELSQKAAALTSQSTSRTNQASGGSPAVFTGIANIERTLKSMESRLARLEAQKGKSQIVASLREDINRFKASGGFPEDGEGGSWIFVAIFGVVGIAVPVVYYLTKKPASKKFI